MKKIAFLIFLVFFMDVTFSQNLSGAWIYEQDSTATVWIIADGYYMKATYTAPGNRFVSASGGKLTQPGSGIQLEVEFNSIQKEDVGSHHQYDLKLEGDLLTTIHHDAVEKWRRLDAGKPGQLAGAWLFSGRKQKPEEDIQPYTPGVRKTMKIMSGTRFQWAAYNTETREFFGTGGGTYITLEGRYTENIYVFSRDNSRVGASLTFQMELQEPHWLHSGKSSKGDNIYERWSRRKSFDGQ